MSRSTFLTILKFLALLIVSIDAQYQQNRQIECEVNGQQGACIPVRNCQMVTTILQQSPEEVISYLRQNHCGFEGSNPLVCCPTGGNSNVNTRPGGDEVNPDNRYPFPSPQNENVPMIDLTSIPYLPNVCGRDLSQKIFGGERTELDEFPWMALLEYQKPNGRTTACGGVLISKRYILTAAHCIKGKDLPPSWRLINVRLGEYDTDTEIDCIKDGVNSTQCADEPISVGVEEQIAHEEYRPLSRDQSNDIALLRLTHDVPFTNFIKPICLPTNPTVSNKLFVAGWGKTENRTASNVKLKLSLPLTRKEQCEQTYNAAGVRLGSGQICAGGQRGKDSCRGDSGGPLMAIERMADGTGRWAAVGVVSFGPSPCGMEGWPGVYTKVSQFIPWIVSKLRA